MEILDEDLAQQQLKLPYKTFLNKADATECKERLEEANIKSSIEISSSKHDEAWVSSQIGGLDISYYIVLIAPNDFVKANDVMHSYIATDLKKLPKDYPLYTFTKEELLDIVQKPDEWTELDLYLALELLEKQGIMVSREEVKKNQANRKYASEMPQKGNLGLMILLCALIIFVPFWGSIIGFAMGLNYYKNNKILNDGRRILIYDHATRQFGFWMIVLSAIAIIGFIFLTNIKNALTF